MLLVHAVILAHVFPRRALSTVVPNRWFHATFATIMSKINLPRDQTDHDFNEIAQSAKRLLIQDKSLIKCPPSPAIRRSGGGVGCCQAGWAQGSSTLCIQTILALELLMPLDITTSGAILTRREPKDHPS